MRYGYFDGANREYVITNPRIPVKWINYLGTRNFGGFIDHTGGTLICAQDPALGRITKYIQQLPASEFQGTGLYLRIYQDGAYRLFSPFYVPTLIELQRFECRVGLGYSRFVAEQWGLLTEITVFVPANEQCLLTVVEIQNISAKSLDVEAIPVVEYTHPDALQQFTNADWVPQTMQSRALWQDDLLVLLQYPFMRRDTCINYLTANIPASSFETERQAFVGMNGYGTFQQPGALALPTLGNTEALRGDNIGAMLLPLGEIEPGASRQFVLQLGQASDMDAAGETIRRFRDPAQAQTAFQALGRFWDEYLASLQVETPDGDMDLMLNLHNPYQCYVTKTWSRYLSTYQPGLGARGIGYRDSMQDVMAVLPGAAEEAKEFLTLLLRFQKADGSAMHQFNPLSMVGSEGDSLEMEDRPHYYSDDHLWGVIAVTAYLRETGDLDFLDQKIPFYAHPDDKAQSNNATVRQHLERALQYTSQDTGQHGLPLLGFADWNDTVNLPTGAESLFSACLYGYVLLEMIDLMHHLGDQESAQSYQSDYAEMKSRFQRVAWDGSWFRRYFDAQARPLGSVENEHAQIYLNAQSWAVLSGFTSQEQAHSAMQAVFGRLNTEYGLKLSDPGYDGYDPEIGGVTTYPPGTKENGGIFLHPNPWAMMAEAMLGNGERAYQYYTQINPISKNDQIEVYECEPYVYAQNILGPEHPQFGLARNSWLTGTAGWCYQAATQWILGIRPDYDGLRIAPVIPSSWDGFKAERKFRNVTYAIEVVRVGPGSEISIEVDGKPIEGDLVPLPSNDPDMVRVFVRLG
jgi:cellobiose phosphorylase